MRHSFNQGYIEFCNDQDNSLLQVFGGDEIELCEKTWRKKIRNEGLHGMNIADYYLGTSREKGNNLNKKQLEYIFTELFRDTLVEKAYFSRYVVNGKWVYRDVNDYKEIDYKNYSVEIAAIDKLLLIDKNVLLPISISFIQLEDFKKGTEKFDQTKDSNMLYLYYINGLLNSITP